MTLTQIILLTLPLPPLTCNDDNHRSGFADLLMRPNLGNEDRLITIKTLADLAQDKENAIKISRSPKIPVPFPLPSTPKSPHRHTNTV